MMDQLSRLDFSESFQAFRKKSKQISYLVWGAMVLSSCIYVVIVMILVKSRSDIASQLSPMLANTIGVLSMVIIPIVGYLVSTWMRSDDQFRKIMAQSLATIALKQKANSGTGSVGNMLNVNSLSRYVDDTSLSDLERQMIKITPRSKATQVVRSSIDNTLAVVGLLLFILGGSNYMPLAIGCMAFSIALNLLFGKPTLDRDYRRVIDIVNK